MATNGKSNGQSGGGQLDLVVVQLSGGNDYLNTIVPYDDGLYYDYRPNLSLKGDSLIPIDDRIALHPELGLIKRLYDEGKVAIIMGIGYPQPNRSHFRSMDIWHTAEPHSVANSGWLGRAAWQLDPSGGNPVLAVNFGRGLPRALAYPGVPAASVGQLESYGLFTEIASATDRAALLDVAARVYSPEGFDDWASRRLLETGTGALNGAGILREAAASYASGVEYDASNPIAQSLKGVAQVKTAGIGTRIFYTQHGSFDTHTNELANHAQLWREICGGLESVFDDLASHDKSDDTVFFVFTEFGRRIGDNGTGTDHGSGGLAFVIGDRVKGGLYGEYPSLKPEDQLEGDIHYNTDFRQVYSSLLEQVLGVESRPVLNEQFDQLDLIAS